MVPPRPVVIPTLRVPPPGDAVAPMGVKRGTARTVTVARGTPARPAVAEGPLLTAARVEYDTAETGVAPSREAVGGAVLRVPPLGAGPAIPHRGVSPSRVPVPIDEAGIPFLRLARLSEGVETSFPPRGAILSPRPRPLLTAVAIQSRLHFVAGHSCRRGKDFHHVALTSDQRWVR